jgi:glycosyltransferase involved in cell wall biosynthesis
MSKPITVVSFGPGLSVPGGITRVIELIGTHLASTIQSRHVPTFTRFTGDPECDSSDRGSYWGQVIVYLGAVGQAVRFRFRRRTVFHVHFAGRGSLLRKGLLCVLLRSMGSCYLVHSHVAGTDLYPHWMPVFVRRLVLWGLSGARKVIVLTQFWSDFYASLLGAPANRIVVLPNPADIPDTVPDRTERGQLQLLFLGRVGERKGAFDLIRAFAALDPAVQNRSRLTLAGDGDVEAARSLAAELGVESRISIPGWVGPSEVKSLLTASDVLLLPSYAEGMAMALIEGMSWGLAVVATNVGGQGEFLEDGRNSLLIKPGNLQSISSAITVLDANPALRLQLGRAARETISRFAIPGYIATLRGIYAELVDPAAQSPVSRFGSEKQYSSAPASPPLDSV